MFIGKWLFEKVLAFQENGWSRALDAKQEECDIISHQLADALDQIAHERARAESAINRLLVRDAKVYPLNAAEGAVPSPEADRTRERETLKVFADLNAVNEDEGKEDTLSRTHVGPELGTVEPEAAAA